jgi:biopolymer transport protein ExbD
MSARRRANKSDNTHETEVDLIPMMDLALNLTFFFVVLTTLAKDEVTRGINLPLSTVAFKAEEAAIPDSISINVDAKSFVLSWGLKLSLKSERDMKEINRLLSNEAKRANQFKKADASGLATTVIFRIDSDADCGDFQKLIDACRTHGFRKFILRSRAEQ